MLKFLVVWYQWLHMLFGKGNVLVSIRRGTNVRRTFIEFLEHNSKNFPHSRMRRLLLFEDGSTSHFVGSNDDHRIVWDILLSMLPVVGIHDVWNISEWLLALIVLPVRPCFIVVPMSRGVLILANLSLLWLRWDMSASIHDWRFILILWLRWPGFVTVRFVRHWMNLRSIPLFGSRHRIVWHGFVNNHLANDRSKNGIRKHDENVQQILGGNRKWCQSFLFFLYKDALSSMFTWWNKSSWF